MKFLNTHLFEALKINYFPALGAGKLKRFQRPWGYYQILHESPVYKVKQLFVNPYSKISLQSHSQRSEYWVVVSGIANIILNDERLILKARQSIEIPYNAKHRLSNETNEMLIVVETQIGSYLEEDDIIRYEDIYNRK